MAETKATAKRGSEASSSRKSEISSEKAPKKVAEHKTAQPAAAQSTESNTVIIKGKALSTRGRTFVGTVISNRMSKTVTVEWDRKKYVTKYQRYEKRRTRVKAHDPIGLQIGDIVEIVETRPISKTKNFLVMRKIR